MANLIFYDSNIFQSKLAALVAMSRYRDDLTLYDVYGKSTGNMNTYIGALTAIYDKIIVCSNHTQAGGTSVMRTVDFLVLESKLIPGYERTGTAQAGGTGVITLDSGASATDDYYKGMYILITAGTGINNAALCTAYNGSTKVATVDRAWEAANPVSGTTFVISADLLCFGREMSSHTQVRVCWETINSGYSLPPLLSFLGGDLNGKLYPRQGLTADAVAAGSLTDTGEFTGYENDYDAGVYDGYDFYCGIESDNGTKYSAGQARKITSNDANTLTLAENFNPVPTGTVKYQISQGQSSALWNIFLPYSVETKYHFAGTTIDHELVDDFLQLVDRYDGISRGKSHLFADSAKLAELAEEGKLIFDAINKGATT